MRGQTAGLHERDYIERTIATVRNHRGAENCWPQWANILADEIERLWRVEEAMRDECDRALQEHGPGSHTEPLARLLALANPAADG